MFCRNCGSELREGALFCPNCGSKVAQAEENIYNNVPKQETNIRSIKKAEAKESKFDIKKYIPIIAVAVVLIIVIGAVVFREPKEMGQNISSGNEQNQTQQNQTEQNQIQQNQTQQNQTQQNTEQNVQQDSQENVDVTEKEYVGYDTIDKNGLKLGGVDIFKYKNLDNMGYYELRCNTFSGNEIDCTFDSVDNIIEYVDVTEYVIAFGNSNIDYFLQLWTGGYDEGAYQFASQLNNSNENFLKGYSRVVGGDSVLVQTDTYAKVIYEIENDTYKGYEGLICDTEYGVSFQFTYLERKNIYDENRVKEISESIDVKRYDYNQAG